jgi:4-amino-4-deoxy-L-arabinose transferase-like glycosyltransferase
MPLFKSAVWRWGRFFLLAFLAIRLLFWVFKFPNPDEAYYWLWGQHPGFSYYDHPPFHAWVQGLFAGMFGRSNLVLRLPNLVSNLLLALFYYRICHYLYGREAVDRFWLVVLLVVSSPLFFLFLGYAWHDHWLVTFAVISSFWFLRFVDGYRQTGQGNSLYLYGSALTLGLAGLCKYTAIFVGLAFLATLLSDRKLWRLGRDRRLYLALIVLALTLSPILLWNWQNDFYSFRFYADRSASNDGFSLNPLQPLVFLLLCALILGPIQSWSLLRLLPSKIRPIHLLTHPTYSPTPPTPPTPPTSPTSPTPPTSPPHPPSPSSTLPPIHPPTHPPSHSLYPTLALWLFTLSTATFTLLSLTAVAIYYWNILAYPLLFPLLTDQFYRPGPKEEQGTHKTPIVRRRQLAVAQGLGLFAATALVFHYTVVPFTAFLGGAVDPDSAALFGWQEVAEVVEANAADLDSPLLLTTDYRSASALAYGLDDPTVMAISGRIDQFDFWYDNEVMNGRDAVLLGESWHPICPTHLAMFERTEPPVEVTVRRFGRELQTYQIVKGYGFNAGPEKFSLSLRYPLAFTTDGERCLTENGS